MIRRSHRCLGRPLHTSFRFFLETLEWWWEMGQEFVFSKTCGGGINLCVLNSQVYSKLSHLKIVLFHQFLGPLVLSFRI